MKLDDVTAILEALNEAEARYLIVGGIAVVAHGYVRYTADLDIVLNLERENVIRAMDALEAIGYRPLVPVKGSDFADAALRQSWKDEKGMIVFQLMNLDRRDTRLDVFVTEPFDFKTEYAAAAMEVVAGVKAPVLRIDTLLAMKREVARPKDLIDVEELRKLLKNRKHE